MTEKKPLKNGLTNIRGTQVGHLSVMSKVPGKRLWMCRCSCGEVLKVAHNRLIDKNNPKTYCGCKRGGLPKKFFKEYHTWHDARNRCHNPNHPSFPNYGAKGIVMCEAWRVSFEVFLKDMGPRPKGGSLDRINPHGPYAPENCRWADVITQARNKKNTKMVKHPKTGEPVAAAALADELGLSYQQLRNRMIKDGTWENDIKNQQKG